MIVKKLALTRGRLFPITKFLLCCLLLITACQPIQPLEDNLGLHHTPTPDLAGMQTEIWFSTAPDGQWLAEGLVALPSAGEDQYYTELRVKKVGAAVEWMPVTGWSNFGLGYTTPRPVHWSSDGRYLYFTNAPMPDGCALFVNASDLQRLDLNDGSVRELLSSNFTNALAFAPDGSAVALSHKNELYLLDPATTDYAAFLIERLEAGDQWGKFAWSADSRQFAFVIAHQPCQSPQWSHSLVIMDRQTGSMTIVVEKDRRRFQPMTWIDAEHLLLTDHDQKEWVLDLSNGEITVPNTGTGAQA